jgi:hypothetical protein
MKEMMAQSRRCAISLPRWFCGTSNSSIALLIALCSIRSVIDDADELGRGALEVVDGPGVVALPLDRSLTHCGGIIGRVG